MKLGTDCLIRIIEIVRLGITEGKDISHMLRSLELDVALDDTDTNVLVLNQEYKKLHAGDK